MVVKPGQKVSLKGSAKDPDGDKLSYRWWQYEEVDSYKGKISIQNASSPNTTFTVPETANSGETIHLILEVTDSGTPKLTRYQRVIATVVK